MTQFQPDWPGQPLPRDRPVRASDLTDARFSVAFRGYRMAEVDEALDRLAVEIALRDERIQQLTGQPFDVEPSAVTVVPAVGEPPAYESDAYDPAAFDPTQYQRPDTAIYQPSAPFDPNANPYSYEPNPYNPGAYDPSAYQPPQPDPAPPAQAQPYEPHGYPPGVLDGGGQTQPIPPVPDPGSSEQRTPDQRSTDPYTQG